MLYWLLKPFGLLILWIFFKRIEVQGRENIPSEGPVIFAGNHPNMLLDALLLAAFTHHKVHYLAKSTLFRSPIAAWFLRSVGVLPVYRRQDDPSQTEKNQSTFEACFELLERKGAIGIFPEGTSHAEPRLMSLKTGVARIALGAEERNDFQLGVRIVPVGLNFRHRDRFRGSVLIVYGRPIEVKEFRELYQKDPKEAVYQLTEEVERRLQRLIVNIQSREDAQFIEKIERIFRKEFLRERGVEGEENRLMTNLVFNQALVDGYHYFHRYAPERVAKLKGEIESYLQLVEECGIEPDVVGLKLSRSEALWYVTYHLVFLLLGFPLFLYSLVWNYLPYRLPGILAQRMSQYLEEKATIKLLAGLVTFPLFYLLWTGIALWWQGWAFGLVFGLTLPLSGLFALYYLDFARPFLRSVQGYLRYIFAQDLKEQLEEKKARILAELHELAQEYLQVREREKSEVSGHRS